MPLEKCSSKNYLALNINGNTSNLDKSTFLNDVPDGGTMFKYQNITIPAKKGLTLIWPAGFTHVHKGQVSHTKDKLILTGWWRLKNE